MVYLPVFANLAILFMVVLLFLANMHLYRLVKGRGDNLEATAKIVNQSISKYLHHVFNYDLPSNTFVKNEK